MLHVARLTPVLAILAAAVRVPTGLAAEDVYYEIGVQDLKISAGELPKTSQLYDEYYRFAYSDPRREWMVPDVVIDKPAEGYFDHARDATGIFQDGGNRQFLTEARLLLKSPPGKEITGILRLPTGKPAGMARVKFSVPIGSAKESKAERFQQAKREHYVALHRREIPGTAWFGHQIREMDKQLHGGAFAPPSDLGMQRDWDDVYALFSGGRAISENLQLTRTLRETVAGETTIPVDSLEGITVAEIDWKPLLRGVDPKLDPLAKFIPADQHAVFFPNFEAAIKLSDDVKGGNADLLRLAEPRSEDAQTLEFYQRQLGLPLSVLARALGGKVVQRVALTGSDPYFRVGNDVAVLLEAKNGIVVMTALLTQIQNSAANEQNVSAQQGQIDGISYQSFVTPNRRMSSYVAQLGDAVVVTNSQAQLKNLIGVFQGKPSLASLDEYKFFRHRYPLADAGETTFVFLSDATIRRWCSARWRIASARRMFAAGALAELTAAYAQDIGDGEVEPGAVHTDLPLVGAGKLKLTAGGVESSALGSIEWMTPIVEMPIDKVTKAEADSYTTWRNNYQRNWRWAFDPIGLRIGLGKDKLAADLTVMPLIASTEYNWLDGLARGAKIVAGGGDQHDALMQVACAINTKSNTFAQLNQISRFIFAERGGPQFEPFGWLGETVSIYIDDDPIWKEAAEAPLKDRVQFFQKNAGRLPIALYADVKDPLQLTAFLAGLRAFLGPAAPGMLAWETRDYRDEAYVRVTLTRQGRQSVPNEIDGELALFYSPSGDGIVFSMNEAVLKRAIDRRLERRAVKEQAADGKVAEKTGAAEGDARATRELQPWLGESLCLQVDQRMFEIFKGSLFSAFDHPDAEQALMQSRSWSNLPILNEWKRMFPDQDPVDVHTRLWRMKLICPGGGKYVWNDEWKTMESTVYGHPGQPKRGPGLPAALREFSTANFGLTFEEEGLRARMELLRP